MRTRIDRHLAVLLFALPMTLLGAGCASDGRGRPRMLEPGPLSPWAEPIPDALAVGEEAFPDGFSRDITTLQSFDGRLWIGYGDATRNIGTKLPVVFRWFENGDDTTARTADVLAFGQGAPQRSAADTGEEQIEPYRIIDGNLWQPGVDSNDPDEAWTQAKSGPMRVVDGEEIQTKLIEGNVFMLEPGRATPVWRKYRSIPGGEHVHDMAGFHGSIYAAGSGADFRFEFEAGQVFRYLWRSKDGGKTFETVLRVKAPEVGYDTRFRRLLAIGDTLYVLGYVNPFQTQGPLEGRHLLVRHENDEPVLTDLEGPLSDLVPLRTLYVPGVSWGLIVAREGRRGATHTFLAERGGYRELEQWSGRRVIDIAFDEPSRSFLMIASDDVTVSDDEPKRFAIYRGSIETPDVLEEIRELDEVVPSSMAIFDGALFVGTADGRVYKAPLGKP